MLLVVCGVIGGPVGKANEICERGSANLCSGLVKTRKGQLNNLGCRLARSIPENRQLVRKRGRQPSIETQLCSLFCHTPRMTVTEHEVKSVSAERPSALLVRAASSRGGSEPQKRRRMLAVWYRIRYRVYVPPKIRELEARLRKAGFSRQAAKGSHRKWIHDSGRLVVISGKEGDDAKRYQEQAVEEAIKAVGR